MHTYTHEQFLKLSVLGVGLVSVCLFRFGISCVFYFVLDYFVLMLLWLPSVADADIIFMVALCNRADHYVFAL